MRRNNSEASDRANHSANMRDAGAVTPSIAAAIAEAGAGGGNFAVHSMVEDLVGLTAYREIMHCPSTERLSAYSEDRLPLDDSLEIAEHESTCPVCTADIQELRSFVGQAVSTLFAAMPAWNTPYVERYAERKDGRKDGGKDGHKDRRDRMAAPFAEDGAACVTVAAASGMGKTRFLLETAVAQSALFPDGVWYVPAANAPTAPAFAAELARAVQLAPERRTALEEQLSEFFSEKRALLLVDDLTAEAAAVAVISRLVSRCPGLRCLVAGGAGIGLNSETVLPLKPMLSSANDSDGDRFSDGMRLFEAHIRTFEPSFALERDEPHAISEICRYAGGVPLSIEIAAARAHDVSPAEMRRDLSRHPSVVNGVSLDGLMGWSYDLLSPRERSLLLRLSVFGGSFSVDQASEICAEQDALPLLENLLRNALLQRVTHSSSPRFQLLSPVRSFAATRLGADTVPVQRRFFSFYLNYAQSLSTVLNGEGQIEAIESLSADLPNLRHGMELALKVGEKAVAGRYALALRHYFLLQGEWAECAAGLRDAVEAFMDVEEESSADEARIGLAGCLTVLNALDEAQALLVHVADTAAARGDERLLAQSRHGQGNIAQRRRRYDEATGLFAAALATYRKLGDRVRSTDCQLNLGWIKSRQGDFAGAERLVLASLAVLRERGDRYRIGDALSTLGFIARSQDRLTAALERFQECHTVRREIGYSAGIAAVINNLGDILLAQGDEARAAYCFAEAARRFERLGSRRDLGLAIANQGALALKRGQITAARDAFLEARRLWEAVGDAHNAARVIGDLGRTEEADGNFPVARDLYRDSLERLVALGSRADAAVSLAHYAVLLGRTDAGERSLQLMRSAYWLVQSQGMVEAGEVAEALVRAGSAPGDLLTAGTLDELMALIADSRSTPNGA